MFFLLTNRLINTNVYVTLAVDDFCLNCNVIFVHQNFMYYFQTASIFSQILERMYSAFKMHYFSKVRKIKTWNTTLFHVKLKCLCPDYVIQTDTNTSVNVLVLNSPICLKICVTEDSY